MFLRVFTDAFTDKRANFQKLSNNTDNFFIKEIFCLENNLDRGVQINNIESNLEVEEVAAQLIENREEVAIADYSSLDLNQLGSLLSNKLEDIFEV